MGVVPTFQSKEDRSKSCDQSHFEESKLKETGEAPGAALRWFRRKEEKSEMASLISKSIIVCLFCRVKIFSTCANETPTTRPKRKEMEKIQERVRVYRIELYKSQSRV